MQFSTINRGEIPFFNTHQVAFCYQPEQFKAYINRSFSLVNLNEQANEKALSFSIEKRKSLVAALRKQNPNATKASLTNINALLQDNCFTITTGHQLVNFTGPLYFILKILHTIKLTEELNAQFTDKHFVPVYWMATEDHDYEEIKAMHLFNQTLSWETQQSGAVGRFNMEGYELIVEQLKNLYANHPESEIHSLLSNPFTADYASYFRMLVQQLFIDFGLVIIDGDDHALKSTFAPIMIKEIREQIAYTAIQQTNEQLEKEGIKIQVNPREINLFYIGNGQRERLILENGRIDIPNKGNYSMDEICADLEKNPTDYSPNVVLRPVYQELILPNICYVGGSGEINYWLQLKAMFEAFTLPFPILQTRISAVFIDKGTQKKLSQLEMEWTNLLPESHLIHRFFIEKNPENILDFTSLDEAANALKLLIEQEVVSVDANMQKFVDAENTKLQKQVDQIKDKLFKMNKSKHETALKSIDQMREKLFPGNGLQERKWNLFHFLPDGNYRSFLMDLKTEMQISNPDLLVIEE